MIGALVLLATAAPLTPDDAVRRALELAPSLAAERAEVERAEAAAGVLQLHDPTVTFSHRAVEQLYTGPHLDDDGQPYDLTDRGSIELSWQPPDIAQLGLNQSIGGTTADAAAEDLESSRRALAADVRLLHAHILLLREERGLVKDALAVNERMKEAVAEKLQAEAATQLEASLAELDVLDVQLDLDDVEAQLGRAEAHMSRLVGSEAPLALAGDVPACVAPPPAEAVLAVARERSPKLRAIALRRQAIERESLRAGLRYVPWFDKLSVGYLKQPVGKDDQLRVSVGIDVPVFAALDGKGEEIDLRRARLDAEEREVEADLASDVASTVDRLRSAAELVAKHRSATDEVTARSTAAIDQALASGKVDAVNAAGVHARALKSRRAHLRARERCVEAALDVARLTGDVVPH